MYRTNLPSKERIFSQTQRRPAAPKRQNHEITLSIRHAEVLNNISGMACLQEPTLWAMGVKHALKAIAHRVGSHEDKNCRVACKHTGHSNFIVPDQ